MEEKNIKEIEIIKLIKQVNKNKKKIELHPPTVGKWETYEVIKAIKTKSISTYGKTTSLFEKKISKITKSKFVVALNSGTSALQLSIIAAGVRSNEEVLIPALNFIASTNSVIYNNSIPHFIESDNNLGIDISKLDKYLSLISSVKNNTCYNKITKRIIKAIIPTHVFGHVSNMGDLLKLCKKYKLLLIEDASEALGTYYKNKHAGTFGKIGVLSFNGNKIMTTGAGGAVITNSKHLADRVRFLSTTSKSLEKNNLIYNEVGYNYKMPSLNAAMGIGQLKKFKEIKQNKKILFKKYAKTFANYQNIEVIKSPKYCESNFWLNAIKLKNINFSKLFDIAKKENIQIRQIWSLINLGKAYRQYPKMKLNISTKLSKSIICIPSGIIK